MVSRRRFIELKFLSVWWNVLMFLLEFGNSESMLSLMCRCGSMSVEMSRMRLSSVSVI